MSSTTTKAIVLKTAPYSESAVLLTVFSEEWGISRGMVKAAKKKMNALQQGNVVNLTRYRRLETQLGTFSVDLEHPVAAQCMMSEERLSTVSAVCDLLLKSFESDDAHKPFYGYTESFLREVCTMPEGALLPKFGLFEFKLLLELGYGLSLKPQQAVVESEGEQLAYVSPRSGRAVGEVAGAPYKDKLLILPKAFGGKSEDIQDVFTLTGHFLERALHGKKSDARRHLIALAQTKS